MASAWLLPKPSQLQLALNAERFETMCSSVFTYKTGVSSKASLPAGPSPTIVHGFLVQKHLTGTKDAERAE